MVFGGLRPSKGFGLHAQFFLTAVRFGHSRFTPNLLADMRIQAGFRGFKKHLCTNPDGPGRSHCCVCAINIHNPYITDTTQLGIQHCIAHTHIRTGGRASQRTLNDQRRFTPLVVTFDDAAQSAVFVSTSRIAHHIRCSRGTPPQMPQTKTKMMVVRTSAPSRR